MSLPSIAPTQLGKLACLLKPSAIDHHFLSFGVSMNLLLTASQTAIQTIHTVLLGMQFRISYLYFYALQSSLSKEAADLRK
jgi:hypothetical protein